MATSYDLVFDRFLSKITDYDLIELVEDDLKNELVKFLKSSISDFKYCTKNLFNRDDTIMQFNIDLTDLEQEILAKFMLVHWLNPNILRLENIRNELGNRDFRAYSPSNFLDKMINVKTTLINEAVQDMIHYYYST